MRSENIAPTRSAVRERLADLINEIAAIPKDLIVEQATVDGTLQMQSVAFVELQVAIEDEYQILIDPVHVVELNSFGAIVDYVFECVVGGAA